MKIIRNIADEAALKDFAVTFSNHVTAGDVVLLQGTLGAGKTSFARALIQQLCGRDIAVTSPTFMLMQEYDMQSGGIIQHYDLYRIEKEQELLEIGLEDALGHALVLVEWPNKGAFLWPDSRVEISINHVENDESARMIVVSAYGNMVGKLQPIHEWGEWS